MHIKRRIAAAALALALALGGAVGMSAQDLDDPTGEVTEQAGGTWSFTVPGGKGGAETNGGTWS
jgi:hypothetical protein